MALWMHAHLAVAVAYVAFRAMERFAQKPFARAPRVAVAVGRALFLAAVAIPFLLRALPERATPSLPFTLRMPVDGVPAGLDPAPKESSVVGAPTLHATPVAPAIPWAALAWIVAAWWVCHVLRFARDTWRLRRALYCASPLRRIGRVTLVAMDDLSIPFSVRGPRRAWVVVPTSLLGSWRDAALAIRHELQHHRQRDTVWALFFAAADLPLFPNPFVVAWRRRLEEWQELSCDAALVGREIAPHEYGSCLVRVAETALVARCALPVGTIGMARSAGDPQQRTSFLRRRILMMTGYEGRRPAWALAWTLGTLALSVVGLVATAAHSLARTSKAEVIATEPAMQKIAEEALRAAIERHKASLGFVVVADPKTGTVLAVANQDERKTAAPRSPHWALSLLMEPASIVKAIVTASALERGVTKVDTEHDCENGKYNVAGKWFQDWKPFQKLTTAEAVAQSSNICAIKVGETLGAEGVAAAFRSFGFGAGGSAAHFPEARAGEMLAPSGEKDPLFVATVASGYGGVRTTPLEVVQAFGAIANGGELLKPIAFGAAGKTETVRRVLSEEHAREMRDVLVRVFTTGTAQGARSDKYRLAGKTATGYAPSHRGHDTSGGDAKVASFAGFAPAEDPRLVIYVGIENPTDKKGVHGAYHAAPVFREVAEKGLAYLGVAPSVQ